MGVRFGLQCDPRSPSLYTDSQLQAATFNSVVALRFALGLALRQYMHAWRCATLLPDASDPGFCAHSSEPVASPAPLSVLRCEANPQFDGDTDCSLFVECENEYERA